MISIIVPVYQVEKYLDSCIKSLVSQTFKDIEIVLVDDGSPDVCPQMCDDWALQDDRIKVIHQDNQGPSAARNTGIENATGKYLYFVDSDDFVDPTLCEKVMRAFEKTDADIVVFNVNRVTETGQVIDYTEKIAEERILGKHEAMVELFLSNIHDYPCNKVYKRELFSTIRYPVGHYFEDIGTIYKVFLLADQIFYMPDRLYNYRKRADSTIGAMRDDALQDLFIMRRARLNDVRSVMPDVADYGLELTALSAKRYIDRSLWKTVKKKVLCEAKKFMDENREKILDIKNHELHFFIRMPKLYRLCRLVKHQIGCIFKKIRLPN